MILRPEIAAVLDFAGEVHCWRDGANMAYAANGKTARIEKFDTKCGARLRAMFVREIRLVRSLLEETK